MFYTAFINKSMVFMADIDCLRGSSLPPIIGHFQLIFFKYKKVQLNISRGHLQVSIVKMTIPI